MSSSKGSDDEEDIEKPSGFSISTFMFGNVDENGDLVDEYLDGSQKMLGNLGNLLNCDDMVTENDLPVDQDDYDGVEKVESVQNYSDIDEVIDSSEDEEDKLSSDGEDEKMDEDVKDPPQEHKDEEDEANAKETNVTTEDQTKIEPEIEVKVEPETDRDLMPPPATPVAKSKQEAKVPEKSLRKPLAAMLPDQFKDIDVRVFFPEYKPNGSLRFSRLFPIKPSLRPNIWKNVKKRFKKKLDSDEEPPKKKAKEGLKLVFAPYPEDVNAYVEDQAIWFHKPLEEETNADGENSNNKVESRGPKQTDWRWGPAQYWYDIMDIPENVTKFDYGLKITTKSAEDGKTSEEKEPENIVVKAETKEPLPEIDVHEDAFFMVSQAHWEDDVIWDGDDIKHKVLQKLSSKTNAAGWVPSGLNRTAGTFSQPGKNQGPYLQTMQQKKPTNDNDTWHSIFPVENEELVYGRWEDEVIWDHEKMPVRLEPKFVSLDPNDDNIILGIPEDIDPATLPSDAPTRKVKIIQKHGKKSKMLLNKSGIINVIEDESPPPPPKNDEKDPFNISNDEYYTPKMQDNLIKSASGSGLLQHAIPVVELQVPFVPTHMGPMKLRAFHRPSLRRFSHGPLADCNSFHSINSLYKHMKRRAKAREAEREAAGGGDIFFMRTPEDVSGQDGELVLFEYMEEYPPLLSLVGMCSKVKNYFKKKPGSDVPDTNLKYGELTIAHSSPFLGQMQHGQTLQAIENNLYRAPIYEHRVPGTDFLVIRTRNEFFIREVDTLFVCGQECPLYEVPAPNSKKANNFTRDFLQVFIFRLFWKSRDNPRRIKMEEIKRAFATHSESSIRKRLKPCADFHRTGADSNWWVIKSGFRLPTEEEIRALVSPEQCCAFFSMSAAEQRLKDAGYGEKSILAPQDDEDESSSIKLEDEVKCAPWNTTRAYILAIKEKCLLQLTGPADPTGKAGEGFSYVRVPNKPTNKEEAESQPKRTVTGTDADLRKLSLKEARAILRENKVPEEEIKKLSRWEVIDVVRTLSTEKVKAGDDCDFRFSRGNRFSIAEHHERYREDCQRIFEVQNTVLASDEILSSDEAETSEESDVDEEDLDEMGKNMEKLLANKKSSSQLQREREEMERRDLQRMILDGEKKQKDAKKKQKDDEVTPAPPKILRITRTFRDDSGKEYVRTEIVRKPGVVEAYVRLRSTKDETFIKEFATDAQDKEEMKKEKRRIQEQLRRLRRNEEKSRAAELALAKSGKRRSRMNDKPDLKLKCGACGAKGHMRTNKACPKFVPGEFDDPSSVTEREDEDIIEREMKIEEAEDLINVDGTKVKVNAKVLKQVDEYRRKLLNDPKSLGKGGAKRRRAGTVDHCDYLTNKNYRPVKRRRTDPLITLGSCLDKILCDLRSTEESAQFWQPVNTKKVVDYLEKIKRPMDLQTVRDSVQKKKYHSREEFLADIHQIVENSAVYNGENDIITMNARKVLEIVIGKLSEKEEFLMKLEKAINPLLDDNDQVRLTYILESILNDKLKVMQEAWPFMKPVNRKQMKVYYEMIKVPMDLETVSKKVAKHAYHSRYEFYHDIELIYKNALQFNGEKSEYTLKAQKLLAVTQETLEAYADHLEQLEEKIRAAQQRALDQADLDSIGTSMGDFDDGSKRRRGRPRKFFDQSLSQEEGDSQLSPADYPEEGNSRSNLEDDLQYTSDEEDEGDGDEDDEEWLEVDDHNISVQARNLSEDQESAAHALVAMGGFFSHPGDNVEEDIDENYDPTDFLQGLGQQQNPQPIIFDHGEVIETIPVQISDENVAAMLSEQQPHVDVVNDDLDISDSNDEDSGQENTSSHPQPETSDAPPNDEDGIWF